MPSDGRRNAGDRTRARLLQVTKSLIALHGEDGFSLRDITGAARANVAAVSYHFGSKENLCSAAVDDAVDQVARGHLRAVKTLPPDASVRDICGALVGGIVARKNANNNDERALLAISARALLFGADQISATAASAELAEHVLARLRRALPALKPEELRFRFESAAAIMHVAAAGGFDAHTAGFSRTRLTRWLVAVCAGCFLEKPA